MDTSVLTATLSAIVAAHHPVSIFIYGSRAQEDYLPESDYELGVLYHQDQKISRTQLNRLRTSDAISIYPFLYEDFIRHTVDTPFPETLFLRDLITAGRTLHGEHVIENMVPPSIYAVDLLQRVRFDSGMALAAALSARNADYRTAAAAFSKSCLFGVRCLVILEKRSYPVTYAHIADQAAALDLGEGGKVVKHALAVRHGAALEEAMLYKNISLLNLIKDRILAFDKDQTSVLVVP